MLQRKQTIWLLLASVLAFLSLKFPIYTGNVLENNLPVFKKLTANNNLSYGIIVLILTIASATACLFTIFLYKNRKKQLLLCIGLSLVAILNLILYYLQTKQFVDGAYAITAAIVIAIPIFLLLAAKGIYKDEQLVKSLDRIR